MTEVWIAWIISVLVTFGIFEVYGYKKYGTKGTLSYHFWMAMFKDASDSLRGEKVDRPRAFVWAAIAFFLLWLLVHMATGGMF